MKECKSKGCKNYKSGIGIPYFWENKNTQQQDQDQFKSGMVMFAICMLAGCVFMMINIVSAEIAFFALAIIFSNDVIYRKLSYARKWM